MTIPAHTTAYKDTNAPVAWRGRHVSDVDGFEKYVAERAVPRLYDDEDEAELRSDLEALVTTEFSSKTLTELLTSRIEPQPWELAESLAETLLSDEHGVIWPWNHARDKRTPKASLPGKDLIGFLRVGESYRLVFGEVKCSSDKNAPPKLMYGSDGMIAQLAEAACEKVEQICLIKWLRRRCKGTEFWPHFQGSLKRFLESKGKEIVIWGVLVRDTDPNVKDLHARATALGKLLSSVERVELDAWYCPTPVASWEKYLRKVSKS